MEANGPGPIPPSLHDLPCQILAQRAQLPAILSRRLRGAGSASAIWVFRRAGAGVRVEVLHRVGGDLREILARNVELADARRHPELRVKRVEPVGHGERGLAAVHAVAPDLERLGDLLRRRAIDRLG